MKQKGLSRAVEIAGNHSALARAAGCSRQNIEHWLKANKPMAEYCMAISSATGVPLHELRPDVYPTGCTCE